MTTALRVSLRLLGVFTHLLAGLCLLPFASRRDTHGHWRVERRIARWWCRRLLALMRLRVRVHGTPPEPPALVVSNHVSWLDIPVLESLLPAAFLSKAEIRRWPLIGWLAVRSGTLFIRRGQGEAGRIRAAIAERLDHGGMVALFPEGTTSDGRDVRRFFSRLFLSAIDAGAPIAPAALRYRFDGRPDPLAPYTGGQSLMGNLIGLLAREHPSEVEVHFLPLIAADAGDSRHLAQRAHAAIATVVRAP